MISSVTASSLLAGCSDILDSQPDDEQNSTSNNTSEGNTTQGSEPIDGAPSTMTEIAKFAINKHSESTKNRPYSATVSSENNNISQSIEFRYNGDNKSYFQLEMTIGDELTTVEKYSKDGFVYSRTNPPSGEIDYSKLYASSENGVFMYDGTDYISNLDSFDVEVSNPKRQENKDILRYEILSHSEYDTVTGFIELDLSRDVISEVQITGDDTYSLSFTFEFGGLSVSKPAWVESNDF